MMRKLTIKDINRVTISPFWNAFVCAQRTHMPSFGIGLLMMLLHQIEKRPDLLRDEFSESLPISDAYPELQQDYRYYDQDYAEDIDRARVSSYIRMPTTAAPTSSRTIFKNLICNPQTMSIELENLQNALISAIRSQVEGQDIAVAFSGGLDSGLVAAIAKEYARSVTLYTSGKDKSYDVVMAQEMSEQLGLPWLHIPLTEENIEPRLREMISITGTSSPLTLSFELPLFFVCRTVREKYVLGGQGSDELFAGYSKYVGMSEEELDRARKADLGKLISSTIPHETKIADHYGKKILYPYLDSLVTMQVNAMNLKDLMPADTDHRKMLLREIARNLGYPFIAEKKKKAAQYGSGTMDLVRKVASDKGMTYSELVDSIYRDIFE
ncbi:MAG: hypothetical protein E7Z64_01205 [Thermoplasmata archaeon]|nr:hypothetical protein [Thermoplasmata archaeon]